MCPKLCLRALTQMILLEEGRNCKAGTHSTEQKMEAKWLTSKIAASLWYS